MEPQTQEKTPVRLKGVKDSIWITINPTFSGETIEAEITRLFSRMQNLAVNSRVILDVGHTGQPKELIERLTLFLKTHFNVGFVSVPQQEEAMEDKTNKLDLSSPWRQHRSDALMIAGRVRSGQKISAKKHLIILGDVNPGSELVAGGDILILGNLSGTASAGQPDHEEAIILAIGFRPIQIQIGGVIAAGLPPSSKPNLEFAHIENGIIVVEDYIKVNPFGRLIWPVVR